MDNMEQRLYKLFSTMPVKGVFGNYGEASRYRLMEKLAGGTLGSGGLTVKMLRDKKTVILYSDIYGSDMYILGDGYARMLKNAAELENTEESEKILIPAEEIKGNCLVEFPAVCEDVYGTAFGGNFMQGIFFEAFPYDKQSFEKMVAHIISNSPCRMPARIVLIQNEVRYGATDVTSEETAITKAVESMEKYTAQKVLVCREREINRFLLEFHPNIYKQHVLKKRRMIQRAREDLEQDFEMEFEEAKERFLMQEFSETFGILSSMSFVKAAEYQKVRWKGVHIETAVFENYMEQVSLRKEHLKRFLDNLWNRFLYEIALLSQEEEESWVQRWIHEMRKGYRPESFSSCPDSSIEYRKRIEENKIVVQLENYANNFVKFRLKRELYDRMSNEVKKCEERYL